MDHRFIDSRSAFRCNPSALWIRFDIHITIKKAHSSPHGISQVDTRGLNNCTIILVDTQVITRRYSHVDDPGSFKAMPRQPRSQPNE